MNAGSGLVIDASVAVKWHLKDEELVEEAGALLEGFLDQRFVLAAPAFIRYEVANSLEQARRRARITEDDVVHELRAFLHFGVHDDWDSDDLVAEARRIATRIGSSVYDATYVAFAQRLGLSFVTNDQKLLGMVSNYDVPVHHLADVPALL